MLHVKDISRNQMREYVMLLILELFPSLEWRPEHWRDRKGLKGSPHRNIPFHKLFLAHTHLNQRDVWKDVGLQSSLGIVKLKDWLRMSCLSLKCFSGILKKTYGVAKFNLSCFFSIKTRFILYAFNHIYVFYCQVIIFRGHIRGELFYILISSFNLWSLQSG